jgi:hypothetical protein
MRNLFFVNFKTLRTVRCTVLFYSHEGNEYPHLTNRGSMFYPIISGIFDNN